MTSIERAIRQSWLLTAVAVLAIIGFAFGIVSFVRVGDQQNESARDLTCVQNWAQQTSNRSAFLQRYLGPRNDAQAAFEIAIAEHNPTAAINQLRNRFIALAQAYNTALKANPLPEPPQIQCAQRAGIVVPSPSVAPDLPPSPSPRRTRPVSSSSSPSSATPRVTTRAVQRTEPVVSRTARAQPSATHTSPARHPTSAPSSTPRTPTTSASAPVVPSLLCPIVRTPLLCQTEGP